VEQTKLIIKSQAKEKHSNTVRWFASQVRARAISCYGEANFARMCMEFMENMPPATMSYTFEKNWEVSRNNLIEALKVMAHTSNPITLHLAIVWLDGHGYGDVKLESLRTWLARFKLLEKQDCDPGFCI
jgi:hypothetical protein